MKSQSFIRVSTVAVIMMLFAGLFSCVSRKSADQLENQRDSLNSVVMEKDGIISDVFSALNMITENLNTIKEREGIVTAAVKGDEIHKQSIAQINEDIVAIDDLLRQNSETIADLKQNVRKLQATAVQVSSLEAMVARLSENNEQKDSEIKGLKSQIRSLSSSVDSLSGKLAEGQHVIDTLVESHNTLASELTAKNEMLHTAYYIVGAKKMLTDEGVIYRSKSLFGDMKINENRSLDVFTRVNTTEFVVLPVGHKNVEVLSTHPEGSYELVYDDKTCVELRILDAQKFWEISKVLVVSYK